jgi:aspartyl-tRNA(Asn)/glutamyl-tRNA(Gln) amidotransferase subunit A
VLRNTSFINAADGCALSVPMHAPGTAPAGLMIAGGRLDDRRVLAIGASVEAVLAPLTTAA